VESNPEPIAQPQISAPEAAPPTIAEAASGAPVVAVPSAPARSRADAARLLNLALIGAFVLALGGIAFAAGRMTAPPAAITGGANFPGGFNGDGQGGPGNGSVQGRPRGGQGALGGLGGGVTVEGTVESVTASTLTLKLADGQTIQIALNDSTTYHAQADASSSDVVTGGKVLVRLQLGRITGDATGPSATAGTGGPLGNATAGDVTVVP
jgi:hypothetical protein